MMHKFLVILFIIVPGIDSYLVLPYINYYGIPCLAHRSIMPIPPSAYYFIGKTKMKSPEVDTYAILFPKRDGTFPYKVPV